ncbi:hypothetical protein [Paenibacillus campi]|uniref:hypothetical protein n=1 Tax=Paenibacillus campi TaxID=3106031 RepID=UPI002AFE02C9|nr:hypothetical protein [Paenibacillus sp. SGZ-1014]
MNSNSSYPAEPTVAVWQQHIREQLIVMETNIRNVAYTEQALEVVLELMPTELSPVSRQLYRLLAELTIYSKVMQPLHKTTGTSPLSLGYHTRLAADEVQSRIDKLLHEPLQPLIQNSERQQLTELLAVLRGDMLAEVRDTYTLLNSYYALWRYWIRSLPDGAERLERELRVLDEITTAATAPAKQPPDRTAQTRFAHHSLLLAQSYIHFSLAQDEQALRCTQEAASRHDFYPERLPNVSDELAQTEQWERLAWWLTALVPILRRQYSELQTYADYWDEVVYHLPDTEPQMWAALESLLPLGGRMYEDKLLAYHQYERWMDYQLSSGRDPANYKVTELKPIETDAPQLLLPFYHQAIERHMAHKNRDAYKAAVKLLKRLSRLYKRLKQEERWQYYITQFATRHSRLRALQEELRKGKLIP